MAIFNSYVKLPEANQRVNPQSFSAKWRPPALAHKALPPRLGAPPECDDEAGDGFAAVDGPAKSCTTNLGWLKHVETL